MQKTSSEYIGNRGQKYQIKNLHFENLDELSNYSSKWKLTHISHQTSSGDFMGERSYCLGVGALIFQDRENSQKGIKIYEDYADYLYTYYDDTHFVSILKERQPTIKLTQFPNGIVTIKNKVVGQQIPYYEDYTQIDKFFLETPSILVSYYFNKIIDIIQELNDHNIFYTDIHPGNFLINPSNNDIQLIDFSSTFVSFDQSKKYKYKNVLSNLKMMLEKLGKLLDLDLHNQLVDANSILKLREVINEKCKILVKK